MIVQADVLEWAASYDGPPLHALLCDPPYEMGFMAKRWDRTGIAFRPETWAAFMPLLHPGAFGMAFSGSRGWHRQACAIEDAGFIIHPMIGWIYGSGFPKATRIDTAVDRAAGIERKIVGKRTGAAGTVITMRGKGGLRDGGEFDVTNPATDLARAWSGHRYGLQAMKPAVEPIILFAKPEGSCYNALREAAQETAHLMEALWARYACNAELVARAAADVNTVLSNALGCTGPISKESGSTVTGVGSSSTKRLASYEVTAESAGVIVPGHATAGTEENSQSDPAGNAAQSSPSATLSGQEDIVVGDVRMPPVNAPCWLTPCEMGIATDTLADILRSNSARARCDLSMIWLWNIAWAAVCERVNRSTIETASSTTTKLTILNYILRKLMLESRDTPSAKSGSDILLSFAADATQSLVGLMAIPMGSLPIAGRAHLSPIIVFQVPYKGKPVDSITRTGAGAINVDGGRIDTGERWKHGGNSAEACERQMIRQGGHRNGPVEGSPLGRWPANVAFDDPMAAELDEQAAKIHPAGSELPPEDSPWPYNQDAGVVTSFPGGRGFRVGDSGGASRFFFTATAHALDDVTPFYYTAKASRSEREEGLEHFEPGITDDGREKPIDNPYLRGETKRRNLHPTIKPITLCRWLATLLLPPREYAPRRLLVPFAGTGSEMIGARLAGWDEVIGIEREAEYAALAEARFGEATRQGMFGLF